MKFLGPTSSGSQGGSTWSRNRFGQYVRRRAVPVNPATPDQGTSRAFLSAAAAAWRALTDGERAGWASLGSQISRTDALGQQYTMNGFMAFCMVYINSNQAGVAAPSTAPALATPTAPATSVITLTNAAFSIAYTPTPLAANTRIFVFASPQRSAGRLFEGDRRLIHVTAAAAASPANVFAAYSARFGTPVTGNKVFISLHTYFGGFLSGPLYDSAVVA